MRLTGDQAPEQIEAELDILVNKPDRELQIPVSLRMSQLGGEASFAQMIITWARLVDRPEILTYIRKGEEPTTQLKKLSKRYFGFVSLLMADDILTQDHRSVRKEAYEFCKNVALQMHEPISQFNLGLKVFLICVDHSSMWQIPWLYMPGKREVKDRIQFITLVRELIDRVSLSAKDRLAIPTESYPQFAAILHELFKNTEDWATTDQDNCPWRRSLRGLVVERHKLEDTQVQHLSNGNPAFRKYLSAVKRLHGDQVRLFEFTVFDSGVGLARRWLGEKWSNDIPISEELLACQSCLEKHKTSSSRRDKGLGLTEVFSTLATLDGFIRLRTGRLSLCRDFLSNPLSLESDAIMYDFPTNSEEPSTLAPVFGTLFQILVPIPAYNG